ncbi:MAG TPA: hypothetical protein VG966_13840 [Hyphomicrobiaceae bacterium]|nr:hypothetical protein [Hyphomicrobiaceae bacterium]
MNRADVAPLLLELMEKVEKGHVRWKEDPSRFLDHCLRAAR